MSCIESSEETLDYTTVIDVFFMFRIMKSNCILMLYKQSIQALCVWFENVVTVVKTTIMPLIMLLEDQQ